MKNNQLKSNKRSLFLLGFRDGIPIGLGYLAVSFSIGIWAKNSGLSPLQSVIASLLCNASAGEKAGFDAIAAGATIFELVLLILITNARYFLMSCSLSQKVAPSTPLLHRIIIGFDITDELFGISIARPGFLNPYYFYGAMSVSIPLWALGTLLGNVAGALLPAQLVIAFSVTLYGMFLAVIIPPARKSKAIAGLVLVSFALSFGAKFIPFLSSGTKTIILTVLISSAAALLFPRKEQGGADSE